MHYRGIVADVLVLALTEDMHSRRAWSAQDSGLDPDKVQLNVTPSSRRARQVLVGDTLRSLQPVTEGGGTMGGARPAASPQWPAGAEIGKKPSCCCKPSVS